MGNRLVGEWLKAGLGNPIDPVIQRKPTNGGTTEPAEQQADKAAQEVTKPTEKDAVARPLIVEDDTKSLQPGQMKKSEFLSQLKTAACKTAEEALKGTMWSAMGCPYIERWFSHYEGQSAAHVERAVKKYVPEGRGANSAGDYIPLVSSRLRRGIEQWRETGEMPPDVPAEFASGGMPGMTAGALMGGLVGGALSAVGSAVSGAVSSVGRALFKEREGGARDNTEPAAIRAQLGSGRGLDGGAKSRMESAFGANFSSVRIHTDAKAQELSNNLNARAFTIGSDIAFGAGEYKPGTLVGDALIAHELAHVAQQGAGEAAASPMQKGGGESSALEDEADTSAVHAMLRLWGGSKLAVSHVGETAMPRLKSGLQLQRCAGCGGTTKVRSPKEVEDEYNAIRDQILAGLSADDPARAELSLDINDLWEVYVLEIEAAGKDVERQAEAQKQLIDNVKRMKETASLQVELTKRYKINFTSRQSGRIQKGEVRVYSRPWTEDELKAIDKVLSAVPADYLKNVRKIERKPRSLDSSVAPGKETPPPHTAALWNPREQKIEIYDLFFIRPYYERPGLLLHEIGHSTVTAQDPTTTGGFTSLPPAEWMALSDWRTSTATSLKDDLKIDDQRAKELIAQLTENKKKQDEFPRPVEVNGRMVVYDKYEGRVDKAPTQFLHYAKKLDNFVSEYARTHPAEDLAESFSRYLHDPKLYLGDKPKAPLMGDAKRAYLEKHYPKKLTGKVEDVF